MILLDNILARIGYSKVSTAIATTKIDKVLGVGSIPGGPIFTTVIFPGWNKSYSNSYLDTAALTKEQQVAAYKGLFYDGISFIANSVATTGYRMVDKNEEEIENHPFLKVLAEPFGDKTTVSASSTDLFYTLALDIQIFGNVIWWVNALNDRLSQILPLSPEGITPRLNEKTGYVDAYIWGQGTQKELIFKAEEIIHMQYIDPKIGKRFVWGLSPMAAHKDLIEIREKEISLEKEAMSKMGLPAILAKVDGAKTGDTHQNTLESIREKLENKFFKRKEKVAVVDANLMEVTTLDTKLDSIQFTAVKELTIREIASMQKLDPMFYGLTQTTNRAQAEAAIFVYEKFNLTPLLKKIEGQINQDLIRYAYGDNVFFRFDNVITPDAVSRRADFEMLFRVAAATPNEIRLAYGMDKINEPAMDLTYLPFSLAPISIAAEPPEEPIIEVVDDEEIEVVDEDDETIDVIADEEEDKSFTKAASRTTVARQRRKWMRLFDMVSRETEPDYTTTLQKFFGVQMNAVDKRMKESLKSIDVITTKQTDDEIDSILDFILFDIDDATTATMTAMTPAITKNLLLTGEAHINAMDLPISFDEASEALLKLLDTGGRPEGVFKFAQEINDTTDKLLRKTLTDGIKAGETIKQLSDRIALVKDNAQGFRAVRIARTEINGGYSRAADTTVKETVDIYGGETKKFWYTAGPAEREEHNMNERESFEKNGIPLNEPFEANGLFFPGDPAGEADQVINCKCTIGHIIEGLGE